MASAPTTPEPNLININIQEFAERSSSTLDQLQESPSISVSAKSAPDPTHIDDFYEELVAHNHDTIAIHVEAPSVVHNKTKSKKPQLQNSHSVVHNKTKSKKPRRHKKTTSLSLHDNENENENEKRRKRRVKPLKKTTKSVAFNTEENKQKKKKVRYKKRRSLTPNHVPQKDIEKRLGSVNQYLLPVPRKQSDYKWAVLDPSNLKVKCKKSGNIRELLDSLNSLLEPSTANIALIQSKVLLICVCNMSSTAPVPTRTHCRHSIELIKKYFQSICNIPIPIDIASYESGFDQTSLSDLLSSYREQKFLKGQKSRSNHRVGYGRKAKTGKTINSRWELDTTHKETNKRIRRLHTEKDDINWVIFDFKETHKKNTKWLMIGDNEYGTGGSSALSDKLAAIDEMRYAVLVVVYGHFVKRRYTLLIIWNPMNRLAANAKNGREMRERAHSHSHTITFFQHKEKIKAFAGAIKEMNINLHSKLAESMIVSSLHRDGLIDDIIIRVTHTQCNKKTESNPVEPTAVPRQWTLRELKSKLSADCGIPIDKIRISLVPNIVNRQERRRTRTKSEVQITHLQDDDKTLFDLDINHGSQIYIEHIGSNNIHDMNTSNKTIKRDRIRAWKSIFGDNAICTDHHGGHHGYSQSMSNVHVAIASTDMMHMDATKYNKISTPKTAYSYQNVNIEKRQRKKGKTKKRKKKKKKDKDREKSLSYLPQIRESITTSTPPCNQIKTDNVNGLLRLSKSWSLPKNNLDQSVSTEEEFNFAPSPKQDEKEQDTCTQAPIPMTVPVPLPLLAPIAAPLPLHLIGGSIVHRTSLTITAPPPPLLINRKTKKTKLKTHLDELKNNDDESDSSDDNENPDDLTPSAVFIDLELEIERKKSASTPQLLHRASYELGEDEEEVIPLPDTILMIDSNLVQTESNLNLNDIFITSHNVGRGKTASVHQALYKNTVFVAVKEFVFQNLSPAILADFHKEANTLKSLRHPNIAMLVGSYLDEVSGELYIVLEWLPNGALHDLLHNNDDQFQITYYDVLLMAIDIARGMKYLHSKNIIHRDLKTHNLLLDEEYRVKVTDFGTAKHLEQVKSKAFTEVGTLGYVAPEVLDPPINGYDGKVDVFSYGVILWEIYSSFASNTSDNVLTSVSTLQYAKRLKNGFRPSIPNDCPNDFKFLIDECWLYKPQKRPTFQQIVLYLEKITKKYQIENNYNQYIDDDIDDENDDSDYDGCDDDEEEYEDDDEDEDQDEEEFEEEDEDEKQEENDTKQISNESEAT